MEGHGRNVEAFWSNRLKKNPLSRDRFNDVDRAELVTRLDRLADVLATRFSAGEVAEIIRQTDLAQIRAVAYETLALMPLNNLFPLLDDPLYFEIARNALEQQAFEFDSEEAQQVLEQLELDEMNGE